MNANVLGHIEKIIILGSNICFLYVTPCFYIFLYEEARLMNLIKKFTQFSFVFFLSKKRERERVCACKKMRERKRKREREKEREKEGKRARERERK